MEQGKEQGTDDAPCGVRGMGGGQGKEERGKRRRWSKARYGGNKGGKWARRSSGVTQAGSAAHVFQCTPPWKARDMY